MTKRRTYLTATLSLDKKIGDTHEAELSWRHHNQHTTFPPATLHSFDFKCELYVLYCDTMKCPCICVNLLLKHFRKHNRAEPFQYLPISVQKELKTKRSFCHKLFHPVFNRENGQRIITQRTTNNQELLVQFPTTHQELVA